MTDGEIRERAERIRAAFEGEESRVTGDMKLLLGRCKYIAWNVSIGEYHRDGLFKRAVSDLEHLGFDTSKADTDMGPRSESVRESAENAMRDTWALWGIASMPENRGHRAFKVVNRADDLMECIDGSFGPITLDDAIRNLHDAVTEWVKGDGKVVTGECEDPFRVISKIVFTERVRETPERVLFNPPATIAFWADGTKTVAKCSEGDEFSEYVGLLVCIAKRHLKIPRRGTFEDAMARLLRRAERRGGGAR